MTEREHIEVFFLPTYSPELNPDEYLNGDLNARLHAGKPVRNGEPLRKKVTSHLRSIQKQPKRVRSYFRAKPVAYSA